MQAAEIQIIRFNQMKLMISNLEKKMAVLYGSNQWFKQKEILLVYETGQHNGGVGTIYT